MLFIMLRMSNHINILYPLSLLPLKYHNHIRLIRNLHPHLPFRIYRNERNLYTLSSRLYNLHLTITILMYSMSTSSPNPSLWNLYGSLSEIILFRPFVKRLSRL